MRQSLAFYATANSLAGRLQAATKGHRYRRLKASNHVISSELCDDVIQRLAPTLGRHEGCDIIDFNPGPALWSSKIHNYVKPQRHVLVEPRKDFYLPFLQPLLDASDSRYRLVDWDHDDALSNSNRYLAEDLLSSWQLRQAPTSGERSKNNDLLILANFTTGNYRDLELLNRKVKKWFRSILDGNGFHEKGWVRMLVWVDNSQKQQVLPRTVFLRTGLAVYAEAVGHVEEIAGGGNTQTSFRRELALEVESSLRARERMEKLGIVIPSGRLDKMPGQENLKDGATTSDSTPPAENPRGWEIELANLEKDFREGKFLQFPGAEPGVSRARKRKSNSERTPEYRRMRDLQSELKYRTTLQKKLDDLVAEQEAIDSLDWSIREDKSDEAQMSSRLVELDERIAEFNGRMQKLNNERFKEFSSRANNRKAFRREKPLLMWDNRSAEPLLVRDDEFYPKSTAALLDIQPREPSELSTLSRDQLDVFRVLLGYLFGLNSYLSIHTRLDSLAPGAANAVIPKVPSLRDPRKGGSRDLTYLEPRSLTIEMLREIVIAWNSWPFKPDIFQMRRLLNEQPSWVALQTTIDDEQLPRIE